MVLFKCKMCGGSLYVPDGTSVAICEFCGTKQTLPTNNDDVIVNLYNRANNLRLKCEFDKAADVYEKILNEDTKQAEAHWGIVLCKYGVEYVEDTRTGERVPTCHRTQIESILSDVDYLDTLKYADPIAKRVYEADAAEINKLQKKILLIVENEKPFDVFICYKETDDAGEKTRDSVIANDIYHELTSAGMKVFYAAITLEDKLGQEYEPYIYAALTSSKVMVVIGTKIEYFNATWVKNEWSRYLHLMRTDTKKKRSLIPCFRDMDAYDLPDEFSHLQALDMANIAFMPNLIRGVKKLVDLPQGNDVLSSNMSKVLPLLKRSFMFLEDGEFNRADELLEEILNLDPENAKAYVGKLMVQYQIRVESDLIQVPTQLIGNTYYDKAYRFADEEYKNILNDYNQKILNRQTEETYQSGHACLRSGDYLSAARIFLTIPRYKDSDQLLHDSNLKYFNDMYVRGERALDEHSYYNAHYYFSKIWSENFLGLPEDEVANIRAKTKKGLIEAKYQLARTYLKEGKYDHAIELFREIKHKFGSYKQTDALGKKCQHKIRNSKRCRDIYVFCKDHPIFSIWIGGVFTYLAIIFILSIISNRLLPITDYIFGGIAIALVWGIVCVVILIASISSDSNNK